MSDKLIAFGYYGGKFSHLDWLLPLLPTVGIQHYCEPFGGSAAVLINRAPAPVETYNDLDGEVVNFFKVLREQKDALMEQIAFTPYSRYEFALSIETPAGVTPLERARRFYVRIRQARYGLPSPTIGNWSYAVELSRNDMGAGVSRFYNGLGDLGKIALRLLRTQIENLSALEILKKYDAPGTLFYIDPPYIPDTRVSLGVYQHEMTTEQHKEMLTILPSLKGKVALSGYESPLYTDALPKWHVFRAPLKHIWSSNGTDRQEVLWTNYDPAAIHSVTDLPLFAQKPA